MGGHSQAAVYPPLIDFIPALSFLIRPAFTGGSGPALIEFALFFPAGLAGAPCTLERGPWCPHADSDGIYPTSGAAVTGPPPLCEGGKEGGGSGVPTFLL